MSIFGWIVMILSAGSTTGFFVWCVVKVLRTPGETGHLHGFEIKTPDE